MDINSIDINKYINYLIDKEIDKPLEEQDIDLINEYTAYLDELDDNKIDTSSEVYLKMKSDSIQKILKYKKKFNNAKKKRFNFTWKRILVAVIIISLLTAGTITIANRYNLFEQIGFALFDFPLNEPVNVDGQDVVFLGITREYNTVEEFMKGESIGTLLYPTYVPEGIKIMDIGGSGQTGFLSFTFSYMYEKTSEHTLDYVFSIKEKPDLNESEYFEEELHTQYNLSDITFHIYNEHIDWYQAECYYNGYLYGVHTSNYGDLIKCIESIIIIKN
jgi:hypothetical protein